MAKKPSAGGPPSTPTPAEPAVQETGPGPELELTDEIAEEEGAGAPAAAEADVTADNYDATLLEMLPAHERTRTGAVLFAEACIVYGIDPDPAKRPIEILHDQAAPRFRFYAGDSTLTPPTPDRVRFVTGGGVKVCHPIDEDFDRVLRRWFRTTTIDPRTKEPVEGPLPEDLTLPREAVTGIPQTTDHVYPKGYLRQRAIEAARRGAR